jgi:ssDNA-binding Zn-finger/Zn-ribbon topoisomerase 1
VQALLYHVGMPPQPRLPDRPALHECPVCHHPQTKIQRKIGPEKLGPVNYVCSRTECCLGFNLTKVDTWVSV